MAETYIGDNSVRGVSGGEKRRVSFGVEMVAGRECLLADLPTNGLDSASAYALMRTMRFVCKGGLSMMAAVVQPSTELFQLFHNIMVLSKGAVLYFGPPNKAENHFAECGFRRPPSKSLPQFLEELSAAPESFYIHRFQHELKHSNKALGELGSTAEKGGDTTQQERKEQSGEWRGEERASTSRAWALQRQGTEVEMQHTQQSQRGDNGGNDSANEADKVPRSPAGLDNSRVQCWNELVAQYEASPFKCNVVRTIKEDKQSSTVSVANSATTQQQHQSQQQMYSYGSQGKHLDRASAGAAAYSQQNPQGSRVSYQAGGGNGGGKQGAEGGLLAAGGDGFWYRRWNSSLSRQMWENLKRMCLVFLRNVGLWRNTWLRAVFIGLVLGSLFYDMNASQQDVRNRVGLIFFIAIYVGFGGVQLFPILSEQRPVFYKQLQAGYFQGITYYIALQIVQLPILVIETTLLLVPIWGLSNLSGGDFISNQFWFAWITLFMTSLIGRAWVMVLLAISPIEAMANVLLVMTNILFVTLCGFLIPKDKIEAGWHWFWYISYLSYTFRSLVINDIEPVYNQDCTQGYPNCPFQSGHDALAAQYGIDGMYNKWKDFGRLCGIFIAFSVGAAIAYNIISWDWPDSPEAPDWGELEAADAAAGRAKGAPRAAGKKKSKIVRSMTNLTMSAQMANAAPDDLPASNSQGYGNNRVNYADQERPDNGATNSGDANQGGGEKGPDGTILATKPMRPRDDSIPMPIPAAALLVVNAKKSNSSPALLQKEEQKQRGGHNSNQLKDGDQQGSVTPTLHRAASHDFGFEIAGKQTEALVSGVKSYMQWRDLSYVVTLESGKQRTLLSKAFGYFRPGYMCALMGASGAGNPAEHNNLTCWSVPSQR